MITIITDLYQYQQPAHGTIQATSINDYIAVRQAIYQAIDQHRSITIYVTHPTIQAWLSDLQAYPSTIIKWETVDPAVQFREIFGVDPPALFSQQRIVALDLSSLRRPQDGLMVDPVLWILGQRLGHAWGQADASPAHMTQLVQTIIRQEHPFTPTLQPLIEAQLKTWTEQHAGYQHLRASTLLEDAKNYVLHWVLQRYDDRLLDLPSVASVPILAVAPDSGLCQSVVRDYESAVRRYWKRWSARTDVTAETVRDALRSMSGFSTAEISILERLLEKHPDILDRALMADIQAKFTTLSEAAPIIQTLRARIAPPVPDQPDQTWTDQQWLRWATDMYLPYFAWVIGNTQAREQQQLLARQFSDWLFTRYPVWLNQASSPVLLHQYATMRDLITADRRSVVVWFVIDGMTWWHGAMLQRACEARGLHIQHYSAGIALLPSITSISKRGLVTGVTAPNLSKQQRIADAARHQLSQSSIQHFVTYHINEAIDDLSSQTQAQCYVIFYNRLDDLAHQTPNFTDDAGIQGSLAELAQKAARMQRIAAEQGRIFHLLVGSDHGSTRLPDDATALPLPQSTQEVVDWDDEPQTVAETRSTRAAMITDPDTLPSEQHNRWYVLHRDRYQLDHHYIVPQDYQYLGRRPQGWTHGGLTPEEVVVPLMHFTPEVLSIEPVDVHVSGDIEAFRASTLTLEISNANTMPIESVRIRFNNEILISLEVVEALTTHRQGFSIPADMTRGNEVTVTWSIMYTILGTAHEEHGQQSLQIRRLQQQNSLDDFFDDL